MTRNPCPKCGNNDWKEEKQFKVVNPNGEYVEGYGHRPIMVEDKSEFYCICCGWLEGGNNKVIDIHGNFFFKIRAQVI